MKIRIGTVELEGTGIEKRADGRTASGKLTKGTRRVFAVNDVAGLVLELADTKWNNGERDVRVLRSLGPPQILHNLKPERLRLTVQIDGKGNISALRQAQVKLDTEQLDAGLFPATVEQLNAGSGIDVMSALLKHGADSVEATDTQTRVRFSEDAGVVAAIAFIVTRVLPLKNMWWAEGTNVNPETFDLAGTTDPGGRRCYVIVLDSAAAPGAGLRGCIYVGETGVLIPQRFRQHKLKYKSSKHVHEHGIRLMPELYESLPPLMNNEEAKQAEKELAQALGDLGSIVFGGH